METSRNGVRDHTHASVNFTFTLTPEARNATLAAWKEAAATLEANAELFPVLIRAWSMLAALLAGSAMVCWCGVFCSPCLALALIVYCCCCRPAPPPPQVQASCTYVVVPEAAADCEMARTGDKEKRAVAVGHLVTAPPTA